LTDRVYRTRSRVTWIEAWLRALLAGALVAGTIAIVVVGIAQGTDPQELSQYLAPMTGLTGLAVGYVFGAHGAADRAGPPKTEPAFIVTPDEKIQRIV
jgi:cytochrome bd-type quinol oxidase subunit 2